MPLESSDVPVAAIATTTKMPITNQEVRKPAHAVDCLIASINADLLPGDEEN